MCIGGKCEECPAGWGTCANYADPAHPFACFDLTSNVTHCSACGYKVRLNSRGRGCTVNTHVQCYGGESCVDSKCVCPTGKTLCEKPYWADCADLSSDNEHCGTCNNPVSVLRSLCPLR